MSNISDGCLCPYKSLGLVGFVRCHLPIGGIEVRLGDVGADEGLDEAADAAPTNDAVKSVVDLRI
jgi:hypothetical protein